MNYIIIAEVPGVTRKLERFRILNKKKFDFEKKNVDVFFTPGAPVGSLKKIQPIWFSRVAGYS